MRLQISVHLLTSNPPPQTPQTQHHPKHQNNREEKRILGSHMCQALLEKIKYDLIIARGNESFDVRYNLDVAHAADLPINSLVCILFHFKYIYVFEFI
jgi:hypothetical protein